MSSYNNSKGGKTYQGQLLTVPGSPTGEAIITQRYAYSADCCAVEYIGEAKFGTPEDQSKWFIQKYEYDSACCSITAVLNACNQVTTKATEVTVDTSSGTSLTITGGLFDMVSVGDSLLMRTAANTWTSKVIQIVSDTEVMIETSATVTDETGTTITDDDLLITLENDKAFHKRRWDKREYYIYA